MKHAEMSDIINESAATRRELWLLGQPPLQKILDFVDDLGVDKPGSCRRALIDEWRAANDYCEELVVREAGVADMAECSALEPELAPLVAQLVADARYRRTFDILPTRIAMVELDRLVVCQNHVTYDFVEALKPRLSPNPDPAALFRFCLPLEEPRAPVRIRRVGSQRYVFQCDSTDFRFHESVMLGPHQVSGHEPFGALAGIVGLMVGFSANFLNVIHDDDSNRLLLNNGYHRACALRELGITHVPCVVQTVTRRDELDLTAKSIVSQNPGYYFNSPRPPMLKDFGDPRIRKMVTTKKVVRVIEVSFDVADHLIHE
jgi:hypothetical protein